VQNKTPVSIRGIQHTQGGHTFYPGSMVIDLAQWNSMELIQPQVLRVQTGARWKQVLAFLNPLGLSVNIMQSDYEFSIGGSISANVHGWQFNKPPMVDSIEGFRILLADGRLLQCSRTENVDLFSAAIGGYGLLGIIIDVDLKVTANPLYKLKKWIIPRTDFLKTFSEKILKEPKTRLFFGRFSLEDGDFLKKMALVTYREENPESVTKTLSSSSFFRSIKHMLFAKTQNNNTFKKIRWWIETRIILSQWFGNHTRNQLFSQSITDYLTADPTQTDLVQEYFVPMEKFDAFVDYLESIKSQLPNLMNITVRHVLPDQDTTLKYARENMLCFVMLFRGPKTEVYDTAIKNTAQSIINKVLELKGVYYLPYRPYATIEQFQTAYPQYAKFLEVKAKYDPQGTFRNLFYEKYLRDPVK
jgi:FAD/FMN-containing dehydrogenase